MKSFVPYFDRSSPRRTGRLSCVALALMAACQPAEAFECSEDSDCRLAGQEGICAPTSRCAYPDADCASGYAYPEGAGPSLGGVCLPPGVVDSATDGVSGASDTETDGPAPTSSGDGSTGPSGLAPDGPKTLF